MGYAPLDYFAEGMEQLPKEFTSRPGHVWDDYYSVLLSGFIGVSEEEAKRITEQEFLEYVLSRDFLMKNRSKEKRYKKWDKNLKKCIPMLVSTLGYNQDNVDFRYIVSDIRDTLISGPIQDKWVRNKQVLKPDPVFAKYLCDTDKLQIERDTFKNLPFDTFYIDLEACNKDGSYGDILGIFVNVMEISGKDETAVTLYLLRPGNIIVSQYLNFNMRECPSAIETVHLNNNQKIETVPIIDGKEDIPAETVVNPRLITVLVLQLISYIKATKPDIVPSPEMKSTYRPKDVIKNKYSEVYKQDVGVRIGRVITDKIKAMNEAKEKQEKEAASKGRKPPVPHFRRAHWHRFWTGKGRTVCELRWIEPVFVCGSYSSDSVTDVIIHNVKGKTQDNIENTE